MPLKRLLNFFLMAIKTTLNMYTYGCDQKVSVWGEWQTITDLTAADFAYLKPFHYDI